MEHLLCRKDVKRHVYCTCERDPSVEGSLLEVELKSSGVMTTTFYARHWWQGVDMTGLHARVQFLTRPFVVGDRVELKTTGGGTVLTGFVERIDVMRTLIRTDKSIPVAVPNRSITEMIVSNESRLGRSNVAANFKVRQSPAAGSLRKISRIKSYAVVAERRKPS